MNVSRFQDPGTRPEDFQDRILVRCPECGGPSVLRRSGRPRPRLACTGCGHVREWERPRFDRHHWADPEGCLSDFGLELWLRISCCGRSLWAYGGDHLDAIEAFVAAQHRERSPEPEAGWSNTGLASRLPKWLKSAGNRERVLTAIRELRERLPGDPAEPREAARTSAAEPDPGAVLPPVP